MIGIKNGVEYEMTPEEEAEFLASLPVAAEPIVDSVSARQFKLQLLAAGLIDQVDAWVESQSRAVQISFEYSGTFVRSEPMMAAGFGAMGFSNEQVDAFFQAAAKL